MSTMRRGIITVECDESVANNVKPIHYVKDGNLWFGYEVKPLPISNDTFEMMLKECGGNARLLKAQLMQRVASRLALELLAFSESIDGNIEVPCS